MTMNRTYICSYSYINCRYGILFPLIQECTWNERARAFLYLFALCYCFVGMAMLTNVFMESIQQMTGRNRKRSAGDWKSGRKGVLVPSFWGNTLSNLMGSSVPVVLLCIIEIIGSGFQAGDVGPTVVFGTATFNICIITAICILRVPAGEYRGIRHFPVFAATFGFSTIAHVCLILIVSVISPNLIEVWESGILLCYLPIFVIVVWLVEKKLFPQRPQESSHMNVELAEATLEKGEGKRFLAKDTLDREDLEIYIAEVRKFPGLSDDDTVLLAATLYEHSQPRSLLWYRKRAVQNCTGSKEANPQMTERLRKVYNAIMDSKQTPTSGGELENGVNVNAIIEFQTSSCGVNESVGRFPLLIRRRGKTDNGAHVRVESIDGTAVKNIDYKKVNEAVTFASGETTKQVMVEIVSETVWQPGKEFYLKLYMPYDQPQTDVQMGTITITKISIYDDNDPGEISFEKEGVLVSRCNSVTNLELRVIRSKGADGDVSVRWRTIDKTAKNARDYHGGEGILPFSHLETSNIITVPIITGKLSEEESYYFEVELLEPTSGSKLGATRKVIVTTINDNTLDHMMSRIIAMTNLQVEKTQLAQSSYLSKITNAISVNNGDVRNATFADHIMHLLTFGWKMIFSLIPPPSMLCGIPAFFVALIALLVLTTIIYDLASIFGCITRVPPLGVIAASLLPVGLAVPDALAAGLAIGKEQNADIVLTGIMAANSINIFLGLGLAWYPSTQLHFINGMTFQIYGYNIYLRSISFIILSSMCFGILLLRRFTRCAGNGAALGGNNIAKYSSAVILVILWILFNNSALTFLS